MKKKTIKYNEEKKREMMISILRSQCNCYQLEVILNNNN